MLESLVFPKEVQDLLKTINDYEEHLHKENTALKNHKIQEFKNCLFRKEEMNLRYTKYLDLFKQPHIIKKMNAHILAHIHEKISALKEILKENIFFCQKAEQQQIDSLQSLKSIKQQKNQGAYYTKNGIKRLPSCTSVFGEV